MNIDHVTAPPTPKDKDSQQLVRWLFGLVKALQSDIKTLEGRVAELERRP